MEKNNISWICLDIPEMNTLNIGIWGTMAQHEREQISKRTKVALQALKARGQKLGNLNNLTTTGRELRGGSHQKESRRAMITIGGQLN